MIESVEMGSGCVADMTKVLLYCHLKRELQVNDILNSKMVDRAKSFSMRKITVKARS